MTGKDARFEDANDEPLRLRIIDSNDLIVASALLQDAVFSATDLSWDGSRREYSMLLNRFRWEYRAAASSCERVRCVLMIRDALGVEAEDIRGRDVPSVFSLLAIEFEPGNDGTGQVVLTLSGDREIRLDVESLNASVTDVTRPYTALSRNKPDHGFD